METELLTTKLFVPPHRSDAVSRPRLVERLDRGVEGKLTLVSAPAGFGKTTGGAEWGSRCAGRLCWLSLDASDSELARVLRYLVAALKDAVPALEDGFAAALGSPEPPEIGSVMTRLVNAVATATPPEPIILALDDYHAVDSQEVDQGIALLLEYLPPHLHLLLLTREDPPLPLAAMRARGELTEIRVGDLRFTVDEATDFLNRVVGLSLSPEEIETLEARTEGWIAGLQLAALSMRDHGDTAGFISAFSGSHHFVLDYLLEEVLKQQPSPIQRFLMRTSVLDRLCASLCAAVAQEPEAAAQETLERIHRANLFIVPLDNERSWYRYHHLFADLLRQRLDEAPQELHLRASAWYQANGQETDAFHHAALAGAVERAARLIASEPVPLYFRGTVTPVLRWLESLPAAILDAHPALWVHYAWILWVAHRSAAVEEKLVAAEAALGTEEDAGGGRADGEATAAEGATADGGAGRETAGASSLHLPGHPDLRGQIAALRAMLAANSYDTDTIIAQTEIALSLLAPENLYVRTAVTRNVGVAYPFRGERPEAPRAYTEAIDLATRSGNIFIDILATTGLGMVDESDTRLRAAETSFMRVLKLVGEPRRPVACAAYAGLARISYERNELDRAAEYGRLALELSSQIESIDSSVGDALLLARIQLARGELTAAGEGIARAAEEARQRSFPRQIAAAAAARVLLLLKLGDIEGAAALAEEQENVLVTARVRLATGDAGAALALLEPLRMDAVARGWADELLRACLLEALAQWSAGEHEHAVLGLADLLRACEPEGYVRSFLDEGQLMGDLLSELARRGMLSGYVGSLLSALSPDPAPNQHLSEPLSRREIEVLRLVAGGYSNGEIGERLFLSVSTVKGHNFKIFEKLGVRRRTEAIARARELGLL